jgi:Cysteine-rich secretory protein family
MSSMSGSLLQRAPRLLAIFIIAAVLVLWLTPRASSAPAGRPSTSAEQMLYDAVNHERLAMGLRELQWDTALASAARLHTALLADHDALSHRFDGEADLQTRLRLAGASFSLVAENVALAPDVPSLHIAWMNSAPHRANILDPQVNSVGIAIERRGNQLYATQDFSASVFPMSREEQEQQVARLLQMNGVAPAGGVDEARRSCDAGRGYFGAQPAGIARFETSDLSRLPNELARMVSSGRYRRASVGACEVPAATPFARFRVAVLLYP